MRSSLLSAALVLALASSAAAQGSLNKTISLSIRRDTEIKDIIATIAKLADTNIVVDPKVRAKMKLELKDVRAIDALRVVAGINNLEMTEYEGVIVVGTDEVVKNVRGSGQFVFRTLSHSKAEETADLVNKVMKDDVSVVADPRTNSIIITPK